MLKRLTTITVVLIAVLLAASSGITGCAKGEAKVTQVVFEALLPLTGSASSSGEAVWTVNRVSSQIPTPTPTPTPVPTPPLPAEAIDISNFVCEDGLILHEIHLVTLNEVVTLSICEFTILQTGDAKPLTYIGTEASIESPASPPSGYYIIEPVYDFTPDGAMFAPPLSVTIKYDPALLPDDVIEEDLVIAYYDVAMSQWVVLPSKVDTENNNVTAEASHFTKFAILGKSAPATQLYIWAIIGPILGILMLIAFYYISTRQRNTKVSS